MRCVFECFKSVNENKSVKRAVYHILLNENYYIIITTTMTHQYLHSVAIVATWQSVARTLFVGDAHWRRQTFLDRTSATPKRRRYTPVDYTASDLRTGRRMAITMLQGPCVTVLTEISR